MKETWIDEPWRAELEAGGEQPRSEVETAGHRRRHDLLAWLGIACSLVVFWTGLIIGLISL